jgi:hypothetical protein
MKRTILAAAALLACTAFVSPASAVTINVGDVGASVTTNIQGFVDPGPVSVSGLTASVFLQYDGVSNGGLTWNFDYTLTNTSSGNVTASRISSWGLGTTPNVTDATSTGVFNTALVGSEMSGFPNVGGAMSIIEMCFAAQGNGCSGGGGIFNTGTNSASGEFTLTFGSVLTSISLDAALVRFQAIDATTPNLNGGSGVGFNTVGVPGPVVGAGIPGLLAACGGMFGLNFWRRRRNGSVPA